MHDALGLIQKLTEQKTLSGLEAEGVMEALLAGALETPDIVRFLRALNERPVTAAELSGFARIMRAHAAPVFPPGEAPPANLVDTCGTGGDGTGTFNISTAAALVAAAAGVPVAKHGNRSVSSRCGSADVLEALGVRIDLPIEQAGRAIREIGIGFLFAPAAHAALRYAVPARQQIGTRTVFNLLGPITNPAAAPCQVLGVFSPDLLDLVARTLDELGVRRAFVVHGAGALDEISLSGETRVAEVREGAITHFVLTPEDFGVPRAPLGALQGGNPEQNAALIRELFEGKGEARRDVVLINAAAALVVAGRASDFRSATREAARVLSSGAASEKLEQLRTFTRSAAGGRAALEPL